MPCVIWGVIARTVAGVFALWCKRLACTVARAKTEARDCVQWHITDGAMSSSGLRVINFQNRTND